LTSILKEHSFCLEVILVQNFLFFFFPKVTRWLRHPIQLVTSRRDPSRTPRRQRV